MLEERFDIEKMRRIENEVYFKNSHNNFIYKKTTIKAAQSIQVYFRYYLKRTNNKCNQTSNKTSENDLDMKRVFEIMLQISSLLQKPKNLK